MEIGLQTPNDPLTSKTMTRLHSVIAKTRVGEYVTMGGAGSSLVLDIINPLLAALVAILAVIAGLYTIKVKRLDIKIKEAQLAKETENVQDDLGDDNELV